MEITLVRHGPLTNDSIHQAVWPEGHERPFSDSAIGISTVIPPPPSLIERAKRADVIVSSDLRRAIESAICLDANRLPLMTPLLREAEPDSGWLKLLLRLLPLEVVRRWLTRLGTAAQLEWLNSTQARARQAAGWIDQLAVEYESVLVVSHTIFNQFLVQELQQIGWDGAQCPKRGAWASAVYQKTPVLLAQPI